MKKHQRAFKKEDAPKKILDAKLLAYCAMTSGVFFAAPAADAAVVYSGLKNTLLEPDSHVDVDLNSDGTVDFTFNNVYNSKTVSFPYGHKTRRSYYNYLSPGVNNSFFFFPNGILKYPFTNAVLFPDAAIGGTWANQGNLSVLNNGGLSAAARSTTWRTAATISCTTACTGTFSNKYVVGKSGFWGVKFKATDTTHYGWIQYTVMNYNGGAFDPAVIEDWAYETIDNGTILIGDTGTSSSSTSSSSSSSSTSSSSSSSTILSTSTTTTAPGTSTTVPGSTTTVPGSTTTTTIPSGSTTTTTIPSGSTTTTTVNPDTNCPIQKALNTRTNGMLNIFYKFRDMRLAKTDAGRELIDMYYKNSAEISKILEAQAELKNKTRQLVFTLAPDLFLGMYRHRELKITTGQTDRIVEVLTEVRETASPSLQANIDGLLARLAAGSLQRDLGYAAR